MVCLDSDIVIDFLRNKKEVIKKILELENKEKLSTTSINIFELLVGFLELNKIEESYKFVKNLKILSFDFEAGEKASSIFKELKNKGTLLDPLDLFIASIAITNNESLLTRNTKHFERVPGLRLEKI